MTFTISKTRKMYVCSRKQDKEDCNWADTVSQGSNGDFLEALTLQSASWQRWQRWVHYPHCHCSLFVQGGRAFLGKGGQSRGRDKWWPSHRILTFMSGCATQHGGPRLCAAKIVSGSVLVDVLCTHLPCFILQNQIITNMYMAHILFA